MIRFLLDQDYPMLGRQPPPQPHRRDDAPDATAKYEYRFA